MKLVVQRVTSSSVTVEGEVVGRIGRGVMVLVGLGDGDAMEDLEYAARKIVNMRLWPAETEEKSIPWKNSVKTLGLEILLVSQFTLFGTFPTGNKPDFHAAMKSSEAEEMFSKLVECVARELGSKDRVQTGRFGAYMDVDIHNDGPVTLILDTRKRKK
eukprot:TRINITY_DN9418_c0_g3_i1.p1 TRINITY_DN9418_c0_g3~~TRINITY_DN9418_c0_g3_i1.p1  ORF type:complete len:158 (-),score=41.53 TRINITY_DN9418_c0_g3_i1:139-612(-)